MSALISSPQFVKKADAVSVDKGNGTKVDYYIFPEFEMHANEIAPQTAQEWHHHTKIDEVLFMNEGELTVMWLDDNKQKKEQILKPGDLFRVGASIHTAANNTDKPIYFSVFRYVPDGTDKHELIKNDRYPDKVESA